MIKTSMLAWDKTQAIGAALAASEKSDILARLYKDLASALRAGDPPHVVEGIAYAIHDWEAKGQAGPYFYQGIRADYESAIGTVDDESFDQISARMTSHDSGDIGDI
jgi:hypothetical protein